MSTPTIPKLEKINTITDCQKYGGQVFREMYLTLGVSQCAFCEKMGENLVVGQDKNEKPDAETVRRYFYLLRIKHIRHYYGTFKSAILNTVEFFCTNGIEAKRVQQRWEAKGPKLLADLDAINDAAIELNSTKKHT